MHGHRISYSYGKSTGRGTTMCQSLGSGTDAREQHARTAIGNPEHKTHSTTDWHAKKRTDVGLRAKPNEAGKQTGAKRTERTSHFAARFLFASCAILQVFSRWVALSPEKPIPVHVRHVSTHDPAQSPVLCGPWPGVGKPRRSQFAHVSLGPDELAWSVEPSVRSPLYGWAREAMLCPRLSRSALRSFTSDRSCAKSWRNRGHS